MLFGASINSDDSPQMDPSERIANHVARAIAARDAGFKMISVGHRYSFGPSTPDDRGASPATSRLQPLLLLAHLAAELRSDVQYTTQVLVSSGLHPVQLAEEVATLDTFCAGGLRLGIGLGWQPFELEAFGIDKKTRAKRFEELILAFRELVSSDSVTFNGEFFSFNNARITARAVQKPPPLWIGASVDAAIRRAARIGDSWTMSSHHLVSELSDHLDVYRDELTRVGKPIPAERPIVRQIFISENRETAMEEAQPVFAEHYRRREAAGWFLADDRKWEPSSLSDMHFIIGNPDDCIEQIAHIKDVLDVNRIIFSMPGTASHDARLRIIKLLGKDVLPHFTQLSNDAD